MPDKKKVLLVGSAVMELSLNLLKVPEPGEVVTDDGGVAYLPGGVGIYAATAMTRLGLDCLFCAKIGADLHGKKLFDLYRETGISTAALKVDRENPTALEVILREGDGSERRIFYPGASATLVPENLADAFAEEPDALVLDLNVPLPTLLSAAKAAASRGLPMFLSPTAAQKDVDFSALPPVEVFIADDELAHALTGVRPLGADSSLRAGLALYKKINCRSLIIRLGARGCFVYDGKHYHLIPPAGNGKIELSVPGVADAFLAAVTLGILSGADLVDSVKLASSAAALTAMAGGGLRAFPDMPAAYHFMNK